MVENKNKVYYENNDVEVKKGICGKDIVGAFTVLDKIGVDKNINYEIKYARIIYGIRKGLWENGIEIVGIYKEENKTYIIPFHLEVLKEMNIEPDDYQEYIQDYIDYLPKCKEDLRRLDESLSLLVRKYIEFYMV